ncbi:hypothetical protein HDU79_002055 [Rhizoclosmatium sp. JEL0117]|nr:hypothetical protein HDU79_002055 [Rhizoclosmatium sp. JEL0117]
MSSVNCTQIQQQNVDNANLIGLGLHQTDNYTVYYNSFVQMCNDSTVQSIQQCDTVCSSSCISPLGNITYIEYLCKWQFPTRPDYNPAANYGYLITAIVFISFIVGGISVLIYKRWKRAKDPEAYELAIQQKELRRLEPKRERKNKLSFLPQ